MKLTAMLMQNIGVNNDLSSRTAAPQTNGSEKFNSFLEKADRTIERADVKQPTQKEKPKLIGKKAVVQGDRPADKSEGADNGKRTENSTEKPETNKVDTAKPADGQAKDTTKEAIDSANEQITKQIAEQLGIPVEVVAQILSQLNMQAIDLTNADNLNAFVQKLYGVNTAEELLNVPDVQNVFRELTSIMDDFAQTAVKLAGEIAEVKTDAQPIVAQINVDEAAPVIKEAVDATIQKPANTTMVNETGESMTEAPQAQTAPVQNAAQGQTSQNSENGNNLMGGSQVPNAVVEQAAAKEPGFNPSSIITASAEIEVEAGKLEAAKSVNTRDVIEQIVQKMKVDVKGDTTEIKITLKPEHLGDVTLKISTQNGIVTAQFTAENQRVKEVIEAGFNQLRDTLRQQGLEISQLQVSVGNGDTAEQMARFTQEQERSGRRIQNIISGIAEDEQPEAIEVDSYGNNLYDNSVDYRA